MSRSLVLLIGGVLMFLISCQVVDNDTNHSIKFGRIVDKYSGSFRSCELIDNLSDTICNSPLRSEVSVIILNKSSIQITEKSNNFNIAALDFVDTILPNTTNSYFFRKIEDDYTRTLTFDQEQGFIEYTLTHKTDNKVIIEVFKGIQ